MAHVAASRAVAAKGAALMPPQMRRTFPPVITASSWDTVWAACFKSALDAHGRATASGTLVPPLTNGEAVMLIMAWRREVPSADTFRLWGQLAAMAYGWRADNGTMTITPKQRDAMYPSQIGKELWLALQAVALDLDDGGVPNPRLAFDRGFDDVAVQGAIAAELKEDGAGQVVFRMAQGVTVAPPPKPKTQPRPLWVNLAMVYVAYRVLKRVTGGPNYAG